MTQPDPYELEVLEAFEAGHLAPVADSAELLRLRAAAGATVIDGQGVNLASINADLQSPTELGAADAG